MATTTALLPSQMTVAELRTHLADAGMDVPAKARKDDLVALALGLRYASTPPKAKGKRITKIVKPEDLTDAANEVFRLRAELDAAVAQRNKLMVSARTAGMRVVDIQRATAFASAGAAQAAMNSVA